MLFSQRGNRTKKEVNTMKKGLTELVFILDRSGSMAGLEQDTIGGFNSMLRCQQEQQGEALVSTVLFSNESCVLHDRVDIRQVEPMTEKQYYVGGGTALIDAIGGAIHHIGNVHKYIRDEDVPEHTLFVITTDGMENASTRYTADEVRAMVERQKEKYGWEFLFPAARFGIRPDRSVNYHNDSQGQAVNYATVSRAISSVRESGILGMDWKEDIDRDFKSRKTSGRKGR